MKRAAFLVLLFIAGFLAMMCAFIVGAYLATKPEAPLAIPKLSQMPAAQLEHPLPWTATVTQGAPGKPTRTAYYIPPSAR